MSFVCEKNGIQISVERDGDEIVLKLTQGQLAIRLQGMDGIHQLEKTLSILPTCKDDVLKLEKRDKDYALTWPDNK